MTKLEEDINRMLRDLNQIKTAENSADHMAQERLREDIRKMKARAEWDAMCGWAGDDATAEKLGKRP